MKKHKYFYPQQNNSYKYFCNKDCHFYPCHGIENQNCKFCYCALYHLECKGDFKILENGVKDCSECNIPHAEHGYDYVVEMLKKEARKTKETKEKK